MATCSTPAGRHARVIAIALSVTVLGGCATFSRDGGFGTVEQGRQGATAKGRELAARRRRARQHPVRREVTPGLAAFRRQRRAGRPLEQPRFAGDLCGAGDRRSRPGPGRPDDEPALRISPDKRRRRAKDRMGADVPDRRPPDHAAADPDREPPLRAGEARRGGAGCSIVATDDPQCLDRRGRGRRARALPRTGTARGGSLRRACGPHGAGGELQPAGPDAGGGVPRRDGPRNWRGRGRRRWPSGSGLHG